jgi:putative hydrolase of the HAD superfamily
MRKYEFLFFDLDNTLWDFSANSREALRQTLEILDILSQLDSFGAYFHLYEQINKSLWSDYRAKKITKQALIVERFSRSLKAFRITNQDWEEINRLYLELMALQTKLFPGTMETLSYLKAKGYQMHIITNGFIEVQHAKLRNCGLTGFFGKMFISEEIKTTKPHREIFEHALKSTNALKKKSIMIGDSWETDIEGAMSFGMDQIMFLNDGQNKVPDSIKYIRETANSSFLELKHHTKTYFINEIAGLDAIL